MTIHTDRQLIACGRVSPLHVGGSAAPMACLNTEVRCNLPFSSLHAGEVRVYSNGLTE